MSDPRLSDFVFLILRHFNWCRLCLLSRFRDAPLARKDLAPSPLRTGNTERETRRRGWRNSICVTATEERPGQGEDALIEWPSAERILFSHRLFWRTWNWKSNKTDSWWLICCAWSVFTSRTSNRRNPFYRGPILGVSFSFWIFIAAIPRINPRRRTVTLQWSLLIKLLRK